MQINKHDYTVYNEFIKYEPVAGLTIQEAIQNSLDIFIIENKIVKVFINDVVLIVTNKSDKNQLLTDYLGQLEKRKLQTLRPEKKTIIF